MVSLTRCDVASLTAGTLVAERVGSRTPVVATSDIGTPPTTPRCSRRDGVDGEELDTPPKNCYRLSAAELPTGQVGAEAPCTTVPALDSLGHQVEVIKGTPIQRVQRLWYLRCWSQ